MDADILIIVTCGFITPAKEESIEVIFDALGERDERINGKKGRGFAPRVVAAGCLTQRYGEDMTSEIPELDFLYGLIDDDFVPAMAARFDISLDSKPVEEQVPLLENLPYRYIKVAEGCSNNCSYCAIPMIRGPMKACPPEQIIADAERAAADGAVELILIAQDTVAYNYKGVTLPELAQRISEIEGVQWIRIMYCHPDHVTDELISLMARNSRIVPYLDIPFQHASAAILSSMGRLGNFESYLALVRRIRSMVPHIRIRSTFMVGYPGESEADFEELISFLEEARLDRVGAFRYSPEEGTGAAGLPGEVPESVSEERYNRLMEIQQAISSEKLQEMVGRTVKVLVEEKIGNDTYLCRTEFDAPEVDGIFYLTAEREPVNPIVRALVTDSVEYDLFGDYLENS
jgi:ribosomal protein S12 methylthiotransferase